MKKVSVVSMPVICTINPEHTGVCYDVMPKPNIINKIDNFLTIHIMVTYLLSGLFYAAFKYLMFYIYTHY